MFTIEPPPTNIDCDLCIVGSGPASLTIVRKFLGTQTKVVVLESGGGEDYEFASDLNKGVVWSDVDRGYLAYEVPDGSGLELSRYRDFGGTMNIWTGRIRPLAPSDFLKKNGVDTGWPIAYDDLTPYYTRALHDFGASDDEVGDGPSTQVFPVDVSASPNLEIKRWVNVSRNFAVDMYDEVDRSENVHVFLGCTATNIVCASENGSEHVQAIVAKTASGSEVKVSARRYVLACGGIENARLLLLSRGEADSPEPAPAGRNDWVGRCFMEHLRMPPAVVAFKDRRGLPLQAYFPLGEQDGTQNFFLGPSQNYILEGNRLNGEIGFEEELGGCEPWRVMKVMCEYEQRPYRESRVTLSDERDGLGQRRTKLDWYVGAEDKADLKAMMVELAKAIYADSGGHVRFEEQMVTGDFYQWSSFGSHHMGTTRMSPTPETGVVDADCRVHECDNLYIAGSSVFPSGGASNPTLTIVALSHRLADKLAGELR